jgi:putative protease
MNPVRHQVEQGQPEGSETSFRVPHSAFRVPELLAPAGDWDCARAAVENGADAIYFGLENFNARMRARNFTSADLPALMDYLHRRGVRGYVSFNTLVFPNELAEAERSLRTIIAAGVDAAIVQDVGICRLIRQLSPDFPIHASTQMTITSPAGVEFARELGCQLVVLARECSLKEISTITNAECRVPKKGGNEGTHSDFELRTSNFPLEVFIHGALCVAYSGQCLTSEALGGRSANRGVCAQACRMPYELIADGKPVPLGDRRYLLSPQDLAGLEVLPELIRLGVASLKIEGRLKAPEYVANITRVYRQAIDRIAAEMADHQDAQTRKGGGGSPASPALPGSDQDLSRLAKGLFADSRYELEMAFSRGLYTGWFGGINNQELVHGRFGKKRGVYLGEVSRVGRDDVSLKLEGPLKPGDGVVFDAGRPDLEEEGGRVYEIRSSNSEGRSARESLFEDHPLGRARRPCRADSGTDPSKTAHRDDSPHLFQAGSAVILTFGQGDIDFNRIHVGDKVWKTSDPELERRLRRSFEGDRPKFQRPLDAVVHGRTSQPLTLTVRDEIGHVAKAESAMPLAVATKQPLTEARLQEQLGRLGGTAFRLGTLKVELEGDVMLPVSELNRLRREVVSQLEALRAQPKRWTLVERGTGNAERGTSNLDLGTRNAERGTGNTECETRNAERGTQIGNRESTAGRAKPGEPELIVLVRSLAQMDAALRGGVRTLYCEPEDPKRYREAVQRFREWQAHPLRSPLAPRPSSLLVAPPRITKPGEEWILEQVRSAGADGYLVRNFDHLAFFTGARRIGDYSLNVANAPAADYFVRRFGLECVTASYDLNHAQLVDLLRSAPPEWFELTIHQHMPLFHMEHCVFCAFLSSGTDFRNCGRHEVQLRNRVGAAHPVKADAGCRNTVFNALAQTGAEHVARLIAAGARRFRIEFLNETPEQVELTIGRYRQLLRGEISGAELWRELKLFNQLGVTRGPMG